MAERFVIRVRPSDGDDAKLLVADAMQQVLDALLILEDAQRSAGQEGTFNWKLEQASTNSPFTVTAVAEPVNPIVNIDPYARRAKHDVSEGMRKLVARGQPPQWMSLKTMSTTRRLFERTLNRVGSTEIDFEEEGAAPLVVDTILARAGADAIDALNAMDVAASLPERQAFGELEGVMVAAGRYRNAPALQIKTELYGFVWCCTFLGLINQEPGKANNCSAVWKDAEAGNVAIYTSFFTFAEVFKVKCADPAKPLSEDDDKRIEEIFRQKWIKPVLVDERIAVSSRRIMRHHAACKKPSDGVHLATALALNVDEMHTYDGSDLLGLNGKINRADGTPLVICKPSPPAAQPRKPDLFTQQGGQ